MSQRTKINCLFLLLFYAYAPPSWGQPIKGTKDSASWGQPEKIDDGYTEAINLYHSYLRPESALFHGPEYVAYDRQLREGHPYYGENRKRPGTIGYNGIFYRNVSLLYDLVLDQVVMDDPYNVFKIALLTDWIDSFSIEDHFFIHLRDSLNPSAPRVGFYESLYKGRIMLLKKEKKHIQEDLYSSDHVERFIEGTDSLYYLKMGDQYLSVNNSKSLLAALKNRKKEVRKFIRANNLSMRYDRENTLIKVAAWYDNANH